MAGFENTLMVADNVDFSGAIPSAATINTNGQLLIGSTVAPNIRVSTLTPGTGISITNGSGSITISNTSPGTGTVTSVSGTANQVSVATGTTTPVISLIGPYTPATYTAHGVLVGEGTSSIVALSVGATGTVLTGATGADPAFSATPAVTSITLSGGTALSNYVEGTFTPTMLGNSVAGSPTYSVQIGRYTRTGRMVSIYHNVDWTNNNTAAGIIKFGGLPFTAVNVSNVNPVLITSLSSNGDALASGTDTVPTSTIVGNSTAGFVSAYTPLTGATAGINMTSVGSWILQGQYEV